MNLIKKAVLFFKREGLRSTLVRITQKIYEMLCKIPGNVEERIFRKRFCQQLAEHTAGKQVYIVMACIDWKIPLFQRPHQIATVLSNRENTHVLFLSEKQRYDRFPGMFAVNPHLDVVSEGLAPVFREALTSAERVTVLKSWPRQAHLLDSIPYDALVYEYIDDLSLFYYYTDALKKKHYDLIRQADLTTCTARALYEDALPIAKKAILSPNAGDYDFFHNNQNCSAYPGLAVKTQGYDCVIGYYGCLAAWFDYDLVLSVAKFRPNWCFVLVGYCFDGTISRLQEETLDNIILYPAQPYAELPRFVSAFDIQTIPFVINDITNATSPVKLFEYMASGKPILTSALPECLQYPSVTIYQGAEDFIEKAEHLLLIRNHPDYIAQMDFEAKNNTWDARVSEILAELNRGNSYENQ